MVYEKRLSYARASVPMCYTESSAINWDPSVTSVLTGPPDEMSKEMWTLRKHGYFDSPEILGYIYYDTVNCKSRFSSFQLKVHFNEPNELQDISAPEGGIDTGFSALEAGNDSLSDAIQFI